MDKTQEVLLALCQAATADPLRQTLGDVYPAVTDALTRLGYNWAIYTLTDDTAHLAVYNLNFSPQVASAAEPATGLMVSGGLVLWIWGAGSEPLL